MDGWAGRVGAAAVGERRDSEYGKPSPACLSASSLGLTSSAGAAVGADLLQAVNKPIRLQLQVLHQLWKWVSGGAFSTPKSQAPHHRVLFGAWPAYLPESVKLGALRDAELARLVLADEIVVHGFPIDQGQRVCTLLLPGPQPEGGRRVSPHSNGGASCASVPSTDIHAMGSTPRNSGRRSRDWESHG